MPSIDDINAEKDKAVAILDRKILDAGNLQNAGHAGMDAVIATLTEKRQAVFDQALDAALTSPELAAALAAIKTATEQLDRVAKRMVTATDYIERIASLGTAADSVVAALQRTSA